ncbi:clathrin light chain A isoform X3 [Lutra lutra]|uniref:clathrin light chain A isoform X3 n=1 Tax=Lutra lutra TaxID=9657 RepID=UPI001FD5326A|nr:clathrin light chain A isoform X3 [Lutra lutra]
MTELDPFGAPAGAPGGPALGNGVAGASEEDPAAAFLAQQESEIAGIENDEAFAILDGGAPGPQPHGEPPGGPDAVDGVMNGEYYQETNGPTDSYAAISQVDRLQSEPESIRKWREEQTERLEALDANSRKQEAEWKEKAIKELEEWYARQDEQLQKTKANNSTNINHPCYSLEHGPGTLCLGELATCLLPSRTSARGYSLWKTGMPGSQPRRHGHFCHQVAAR